MIDLPRAVVASDPPEALAMPGDELRRVGNALVAAYVTASFVWLFCEMVGSIFDGGFDGVGRQYDPMLVEQLETAYSLVLLLFGSATVIGVRPHRLPLERVPLGLAWCARVGSVLTILLALAQLASDSESAAGTRLVGASVIVLALSWILLVVAFAMSADKPIAGLVTIVAIALGAAALPLSLTHTAFRVATWGAGAVAATLGRSLVERVADAADRWRGPCARALDK